MFSMSLAFVLQVEGFETIEECFPNMIPILILASASGLFVLEKDAGKFPLESRELTASLLFTTALSSTQR